DPAVEHRIGRLMDQQLDAFDGKRLRDYAGACRTEGRNSDIERLALADGVGERAGRLFHRRIWPGTMGIEDVDVVEPHALQALVERGDDVFTRAADAIGAGPHVPAGLGGDDQFVAMGGEVLRQDSAEVLLRRAEGRAVVVGKVDMCDAAVEGPADDGAPGLES